MNCMPERRLTICSMFVVVVVSLTLSACLPSRVVIDLAPSGAELAETTVISAAEGGTPVHTRTKVALIDVHGLITESSRAGLLASTGNPLDSIVARLNQAEQDDDVKAVVLRINSPGGTVAASDALHNEITRFRQTTSKPVVASMGAVAASGGYYTAIACDHITAQHSTITGSIGVLMQTVNVSKGLNKIGIEGRAVTSGPNKALASPLEPINQEHYAILQGIVDEFYADFQRKVIEARPALTDVRTATDGRVFTGSLAKDFGLVDSLGGIRDAFTTAKDLAGVEHAHLVKYHVEGREPASVYANTDVPTPKAGLSGLGAQTSAAGSSSTQINLLQLNVPSDLAPKAGFYYLWVPPVY